jgi:predicted ATPase
MRKYPAAQLFMERAVASGYGGALSDIHVPIVTTICRRLDGIALAIELAASRAGSLGIVESRSCLTITSACSGRAAGLRRHQTMNAMLDWSYNLLSQQEKTVLGRLSALVGDFTLDAARFVASDAEIDEASATSTLTSLLTKSLLSKRELHGSTYYRLLDGKRLANRACPCA